MKSIFLIPLILIIFLNFETIKSQTINGNVDENGCIVDIYIDSLSNNNIWQITKTIYYPNSEKIKEKEFGTILPNQKEIFYLYKKKISYYENGNLSHEIKYIDNLIDSIETFWYENDQKKTTITWELNKKNGREINWYPDGELKSTMNFIDGIIEGEAIYIRPKDTREKLNVFFRIDHYNCGKILLSENYRYDGSISRKTYYNDSSMIAKDYYENGEVSRILHMNNNINLNKNRYEEFYREDGTIRMIIIVKNDKTIIHEFDEEGKEVDWSNPEERKKRLLNKNK